MNYRPVFKLPKYIQMFVICPNGVYFKKFNPKKITGDLGRKFEKNEWIFGKLSAVIFFKG